MENSIGIINSFERALEKSIKRCWDRIYILVDIHETIFKPTYTKEEKYEWYPMAKETLQLMSETEGLILILWSSSYDEVLKKYQEVFRENGIRFDYVNENPEVSNNRLSCFDKKLYFNVGIDDKCGFTGDEDWVYLYAYLKKKGL